MYVLQSLEKVECARVSGFLEFAAIRNRPTLRIDGAAVELSDIFFGKDIVEQILCPVICTIGDYPVVGKFTSANLL